jgi:hypothetical protein
MNNACSFTDALSTSMFTNVLRMIINRCWEGGGEIGWNPVESSVPALYMGIKFLVEVLGLLDKLCRVVEVFCSITIRVIRPRLRVLNSS